LKKDVFYTYFQKINALKLKKLNKAKNKEKSEKIWEKKLSVKK